MEINIANSFEYENNFYLTAQSSRMARTIAHYEIYKNIQHLNGDIVECGVFKGVSLMRFIMFMQLFETDKTKKIIGFDTYGKFPENDFEQDKEEYEEFITETGGGISISKEELEKFILNKNFSNYELVKGDINLTVPKYVSENPDLKISLLNIDTDIYEPAKTILEHLAPKVVVGGIIIFDDYGIFHGETQLADEYCEKHGYKLINFPFNKVPSYLIKE
ncbi:MAG: dTDP-6-deoxy-L-hexose 3-O-methyltransferase [Ignavibacteria bacterium GWB2_35_12]|nr:MAG: dTDP-6-deoxy-L-hexose 3-O-methyltransferase [Ignavibacteria bacterium GWA2_35_8]OGU41897.1 MAG: dTDP-6-deoxy-L-hexose 3-O-methyltransferase [Ignavibacteria bacterium GWB2_35_12]OGU87196.1 MAG: dTDP-6-deoxy-L-hexose 3-O-methyltransferase [Ignavibacteria bacterium RIFOXYA2_FULL_35_10]OGV24571.1 MAG: dTDP-6-deoxy-L-hexose 3-O-methyltransferase [Ignavibacteria bacterium RIFOXYC2_FULL_35_21]